MLLLIQHSRMKVSYSPPPKKLLRKKHVALYCGLIPRFKSTRRDESVGNLVKSACPTILKAMQFPPPHVDKSNVSLRAPKSLSILTSSKIVKKGFPAVQALRQSACFGLSQGALVSRYPVYPFF